MSWIYTKRKNGKWNIWSTITDSFLSDRDCTLDEIEVYSLESKIERLKDEHKGIFNAIRNGDKRYFKEEKEL